MKKVLFYDEMIILPKEFLEEFKTYKYDSSELVHFHLSESRCEILLSRSTINVNSELLTRVPLKYYASATAGFDHVDLEYLKNREVKCFIASGCNSNSVAEYVIINIYNYVNEKRLNFNNQTIGIIGYGNIGKKVAHYCNLLGIRVLVNDPPLKDNNYEFPNYVEHKELDELIKESDILTNHIPLNRRGKYRSDNLLNENLELLKNDCLFIHSSRGGVVNEESLLKYVKEKNCTLVIDVWNNEPNINSELLAIAKIATPHIAGHSYNAKLNASQMIINDMFMNRIIHENYTVDNIKEEYTDYENIKERIEIAIKRREINKDSEILKKDANIFSKYRKTYPKRYESLFIKI